MHKPEDLFNPLFHITAGQLRACGVVIKDEVPDCGWVPRDKVDIKCDDVARDGDTLRVGLSIRFDAEFQWVSVTVGESSDQMLDCPKHGKVRGIEFLSAEGHPVCGQCFCAAMTEAGAEFNIKERDDGHS